MSRYVKVSFRPTIRFALVSIFILATVLTVAVAVGLQYFFSRQMMTKTAQTRFSEVVTNTGVFFSRLDDQAIQSLNLLASYPELTRDQWINPQVRNLFAEFMKTNQKFYAIYFGFDNDDFYELINLDSGEPVRFRYAAQPEDRWVIISIRGQGLSRTRTQLYYDADFRLRQQQTTHSTYRATTRPWFRHASADQVHKTDPYQFALLQSPGQTYSLRLPGQNAVLAIDLSLAALSEFLDQQSPGKGGETFIYQSDGTLIANNQLLAAANTPQTLPILDLSSTERDLLVKQGILRISNEKDWAPIDFSIGGQPAGYSIDYLNLIAQLTGLQFEFINGLSWTSLVQQFQDGDIDMLQPVFKTSSSEHLGLFSEPILTLPYSLITLPGHKRISHLKQLNGKVVAIPQGWSIISTLRQHFPQLTIKEVASSRDLFEAIIKGQADAGLDTREVLHYTAEQYYYSGLQFHDDIAFDPVTIPQQLHLVLPKEKEWLLPILNKAIAAVPATQRARIEQKWFSPTRAGSGLGTVPYQDLTEMIHNQALLQRLNRLKIKGRDSFVYIAPLAQINRGEYLAIVMPAESVLQPALSQVGWSAVFTLALLLLLTPMPWLFAAPIVNPVKALARENEKIRLRQYDKLEIPASHIMEINDLGESMSVMAKSIQEHQASQIKLMDSFIELIAQAIDYKSPYTSGHCKRVPELAFLLAEEVNICQNEPFSDFHFVSQEEWREFRVAAWLHDCGKITTPLHIVDKSVKLETIYNRIHEIRTRFEVLWRDAEIQHLKQLQQPGVDEQQSRRELLTRQKQLQDDFGFIASLNQGGEFLDPDKLERLQQIAVQTWSRHFSSRLGLSPREEETLAGAEEEKLPCTENVLADKPEHLFSRDRDIKYDPKLNIKMNVPELLANIGEIYNLSIKRGTLTAEERFRINEHIISTIVMLDTLPFPEELSRVPRYASTHHETLRGDGYPRKLDAEDLSVPERIMVLADIFEALTACDRPYQKTKPLSLAIDIMAGMVDDKHIDRDLFELFLRSGIYLQYAQAYLEPGQIDAVDIEKYLGTR